MKNGVHNFEGGKAKSFISKGAEWVVFDQDGRKPGFQSIQSCVSWSLWLKMCLKSLAITLTLIPTAFKMSYYPRGGRFGPHFITIVDGLPYLQNCAWCKWVMSWRCGKCFYGKRIRLVASATELSSYIKYALRQNSVHFAKKIPKWKIKIVSKFFCE